MPIPEVFLSCFDLGTKKHHQEAPYPQDPDERADKAEDDMWYVLQENDELKAKIEVHC